MGPQVLVVGAGPTGLFLSLLLTRQGVRVRLIDRKSGPSKQSRAMGVHARTLELYRQLGLSSAIIDLGIIASEFHLWVNGRERVRFSLHDMGAGLSPFPFLLTLAQDVHEKFLIEQLARGGVNVEWNTTLETLVQHEHAVVAHLRLPNGDKEQYAALYVAGCDGANSATRTALGIGFAGGTTEGTFYVADVEIDHENHDLHAGIDNEGFNVMLPVRTTGTQRLIGIVPPSIEHKPTIDFADVGESYKHVLNIRIQSVNWFSTYRVHHRVAAHFRVGRCFLAGDAGHIHSPVGGQGMNTGIGDAMNLAWKLAEVIVGHAHEAILDTYEPERLAFAKKLTVTTDSIFQKMVAHGPVAHFVRAAILPRLVWLLTRFAASKRALFKLVSQIRIAYPTSDLSSGPRGRVSPGDRLPFVADIDNHAHLSGLSWQLHIYGNPSQALVEQAQKLSLPIVELPFSKGVASVGLRRNAAYLIRPDGYIGLVLPAEDVGQLMAYVQRWNLHWTRGQAAGRHSNLSDAVNT